VQLNVALQTEIVRFTVLGIQKAIRDVEESMLEQERLSTGGTSFFVSTFLSFPALFLCLTWHWTWFADTQLFFYLYFSWRSNGNYTEPSPHWRSLFVHAEGRRYSRR